MIRAPTIVESLPPSERQKMIETTREFLRSQRNQSAQSSDASQSSRTQRKSVSFDLTDNEYIPIFETTADVHKTSTTDNIGDLFLSQFQHGFDGSTNDGYEVPIKYPHGGRRRIPSQPVKGILRSPSPNSGILLSSDRPLRTSREPSIELSTTTSQVVTKSSDVRISDDEIEHDNPFRAEALKHSYENIYEELRFSDQSSRPVSSESDTNDAMSGYARPHKLKPKIQTPDSNAQHVPNTNIKLKSSGINVEVSDEEKRNAPKPSVSKSDRPKHKPPIPPKPQITKTIKQAKLMKNEAYDVLQNEMNKGDFYEYRHDPDTNQIIKIDQPTEVFVDSDSYSSSSDGKEGKQEQQSSYDEKSTITQPNPIATSQKIYRRVCSTDRPNVSPPPPPINIATLPTTSESSHYRTDSSSTLEILTQTGSKTEIDSIITKKRESRHENSPDYSLVTESTHREILLHENELRNAMQHEQHQVNESPSNRLPSRRAPAPPSSSIDAAAAVIQSSDKKYEIHHLNPPAPVSQIFPETKILPVQYSHLPTPQQPGYFHAHPPTQLNLCCAVSHPTANCVLSQNIIPPPSHYHHFHTFHPMTDTTTVFYPNNSHTYQTDNFFNSHDNIRYAQIHRDVIPLNNDNNNNQNTQSRMSQSFYGDENIQKNIKLDKTNENVVEPLESETSIESSLVLENESKGEHDEQTTIVYETTEIENVTCKTVLTTFGKQTSV